MVYYKKEIGNLTDEKKELEQALAKKTSEIRNNLISDVEKSVEKMKVDHTTQKSENRKMQEAITVLKTEKTNLHQHLLDLKRRVTELEMMIGDDGQPQQM